MHKNLLKFMLTMLGIMLLTGCMYPSQNLSKNQIANEAQLEMVQSAVLTYSENTGGLMPIKTKENDVDLYEKYLIDFSKLKEQNLLSEIPSSAYENGGQYQYMILTPEEDPRVKLIDLKMTAKLREVNMKINMYRSEENYIPFAEQITANIYQLNSKKLGFKDYPTVISPYSGNHLPILVTTSGNLIIDYRVDLQYALNEFSHELKEGDDIRTILENNYPFVPAYSQAYTIENNEPIFME